MVRFVSDLWVAPAITAEDTFQPCVLDDGLTTYCSPAYVIYFYVWISCVFDFMPLSVVVYFHHRSFRHDVGKDVTKEESETLDEEAEEDSSNTNHRNSGIQSEYLIMPAAEDDADYAVVFSRKSTRNEEVSVKALPGEFEGESVG